MRKVVTKGTKFYYHEYSDSEKYEVKLSLVQRRIINFLIEKGPSSRQDMKKEMWYAQAHKQIRELEKAEFVEVVRKRPSSKNVNQYVNYYGLSAKGVMMGFQIAFSYLNPTLGKFSFDSESCKDCVYIINKIRAHYGHILPKTFLLFDIKEEDCDRQDLYLKMLFISAPLELTPLKISSRYHSLSSMPTVDPDSKLFNALAYSLLNQLYVDKKNRKEFDLLVQRLAPTKNELKQILLQLMKGKKEQIRFLDGLYSKFFHDRD